MSVYLHEGMILHTNLTEYGTPPRWLNRSECYTREQFLLAEMARYRVMGKRRHLDVRKNVLDNVNDCKCYTPV